VRCPSGGADKTIQVKNPRIMNTLHCVVFIFEPPQHHRKPPPHVQKYSNEKWRKRNKTAASVEFKRMIVASPSK
jgi:hypothetical protein